MTADESTPAAWKLKTATTPMMAKSGAPRRARRTMARIRRSDSRETPGYL
jgi:hypothetical protein